MGIRLSSGSRRPQSHKELPLHLLNRFLSLRSRSRRMAGNALRLVISISASADSARSVAQRLPIQRGSRRASTCSSQNFPFEIWTISPKGHNLSGRKRELHLGAVYGWRRRRTRLRAMDLITILNRCYRFRGFVYQHAHFSLLALPFGGAPETRRMKHEGRDPVLSPAGCCSNAVRISARSSTSGSATSSATT